ncbi:MAG: hypothetical protein OEN48_19090 [Betaproteobacteria bacterium]|nr:hypothetical protein [Betaproteobacteria bacterium]
MPNGSVDADYIAQLEAFFRPMAQHISDFGARHNLLLEKYYHEAPMWSLGFSHPAGGQARLDVARTEDNALAVSATWWLDDYDSFTRSIRTKESLRMTLDGAALVQELERLLGEVLAWKRGAWTQVATGYKGIWDRVWTKAQFEELADQWPRPR